MRPCSGLSILEGKAAQSLEKLWLLIRDTDVKAADSDADSDVNDETLGNEVFESPDEEDKSVIQQVLLDLDREGSKFNTVFLKDESSWHWCEDCDAKADVDPKDDVKESEQSQKFLREVIHNSSNNETEKLKTITGWQCW